MEIHKLLSMVELVNIVSKSEDIVQYGCGFAGRKIYKVIDDLGFGGHVVKFVVSDENNTGTFMGKPVDAYNYSEKVLVAVTEKNQEEIINNIYSINTKLRRQNEIYLISDILLSEIALFEHMMDRLNQSLCEKVESGWNQYIKHCVPISQLKFTILLAEHCNLNCAHCNVFSPIREKKYVDEKKLENDLKRLSELSGEDAYGITLAGGEPLLNPRAIDIAILVRKYFPYARVHFVTNGLLLMKQKDRFFDECIKNDIEIEISEYPVKFDYEVVKNFLCDKGVSYRTFASREYMNKESFILRPQDNGSMSSYNWFKCYRVNDCIRLDDGKLFCGKVEDVNVLKKHFPDETKYIHSTSRDYIDIYKVKDIQEIFDYFAKPFPFCRFCNVNRWNENERWHISEKKSEEWL